MKKQTHGGSRKGSGRPKKEPTKTIAFRVPAKDCEILKQKIKILINDYRNILTDKRL